MCNRIMGSMHTVYVLCIGPVVIDKTFNPVEIGHFSFTVITYTDWSDLQINIDIGQG